MKKLIVLVVLAALAALIGFALSRKHEETASDEHEIGLAAPRTPAVGVDVGSRPPGARADTKPDIVATKPDIVDAKNAPPPGPVAPPHPGSYEYLPNRNIFGRCLKEGRERIKTQYKEFGEKPKKGEFERTADFEQRKTKYQQEKDAAILRIMREESKLVRAYSGQPVTLDNYDADQGRFAITFNDLHSLGGWIRLRLLLENRHQVGASGHESADLRKKLKFYVHAPLNEAKDLRKLSDDGKLRLAMEFRVLFPEGQRHDTYYRTGSETVELFVVRLETDKGHVLRKW